MSARAATGVPVSRVVFVPSLRSVEAQVPAEEQLDRVLAVARDVLGPDVVGGYLHGSAVLGGLRPRSDIDVLVVSRRPTTREEKQRLVGWPARRLRQGLARPAASD
jgi:predicted nucleotidyltransferase